MYNVANNRRSNAEHLQGAALFRACVDLLHHVPGHYLVDLLQTSDHTSRLCAINDIG